MQYLTPVAALVVIAGVIYYLGGGGFGRAQTQGWIDRFRRHPRIYTFLDRHHGKFRASAHYFEFGGLYLILYWLWDAVDGGGWHFRPGAAAVIALTCVFAAWLDEMHQLQSGTRQFRRVDFLHSCCGIAIAAAIVYYQAMFRGLA